jgi:hypothetical protein
MATRTPSGDSIADQLRHHQSTDTDLADVAHSLTDAHAHRPGAWQQDLAKTNVAMHEKGLLPGMDIVGIKGQDFVIRDSQGHVQLVDSTNIANRHADGHSGGTRDIGGRSANLNSDGSGSVQAQRGDNSAWVLSQALLKSQGIDNPTANQMANYQMELEKVNGRPVSQFKPGDQIKIPATTRSGDQTDFVAERANTKAAKDKAIVDTNYDLAAAALSKFASSGGIIRSSNISMEDINKALTGNVTEDERKGLTFLRDHYEQLQNRDTSLTGGKTGVIYQSNLDTARTAEENTIRQAHIRAIGGDP